MTKPSTSRRRGAAQQEEIPVGLKAVVMRSGQTIFVPEDADPSMFDEPVTEETVLDTALQSVVTELGGRDENSKVSVYRIGNDNGIRKEAFLYECHPNEFTLADLQESYGAGDYRINVYGKQDGTNYKVIHANKRITIGPTREQAKLAAMPKASQVAGPAPTSDAVALALGQVAAALAKLGSTQSAAPTRKEMLEEMEAMSRIVSGNRPAASGGLDEVQRALALAGAMKSAFGGGSDVTDPDSAPYQLLGKALETIGPMFAAKFAPQAASPAASPATAALPPVAAANTGAVAADNSVEDEMNLILRGQMLMLKAAAHGADDPEKWGLRIYEDAPDEILDAIEAPDWFEKICALDAAFSAFKPWLEKVRAMVLEEIAANVPAPDAVVLTDDAKTGISGASLPAAGGAAGPDKRE